MTVEQHQGLCLQLPYQGREVLSAIAGANALGVDYIRSAAPVQGYVPVGSVEFCAPLFGKEPVHKNFFPDFLSSLISRPMELVVGATGCDLSEPRFVKCADQWKAPVASGVSTRIPPGAWWVSACVEFRQEWRYYVADGCLLVTGWYDGEDCNEPAPDIGITWPTGFSGAVDIGRLSNGGLELVEAHAPYGCGWYGESSQNELYALWLFEGWSSRRFWLTQED